MVTCREYTSHCKLVHSLHKHMLEEAILGIYVHRNHLAAGSLPSSLAVGLWAPSLELCPQTPDENRPHLQHRIVAQILRLFSRIASRICAFSLIFSQFPDISTLPDGWQSCKQHAIIPPTTMFQIYLKTSDIKKSQRSRCRHHLLGNRLRQHMKHLVRILTTETNDNNQNIHHLFFNTDLKLASFF